MNGNVNSLGGSHRTNDTVLRGDKEEENREKAIVYVNMVTEFVQREDGYGSKSKPSKGLMYKHIRRYY